MKISKISQVTPPQAPPQAQQPDQLATFKKSFQSDPAFSKGLNAQQIDAINKATTIEQVMQILQVNQQQVMQVAQQIQGAAANKVASKQLTANKFNEIARKWGCLGLLALTILTSPASKALSGGHPIGEGGWAEEPEPVEDQQTIEEKMPTPAGGSPPPTYYQQQGQYFTASNKTKFRLSKRQWEHIGKTAGWKTSYPTWTEIQNKEDPKGLNHDLRLTCVACGNSQTCRCSKPKRLFEGICPSCEGK